MDVKKTLRVLFCMGINQNFFDVKFFMIWKIKLKVLIITNTAGLVVFFVLLDIIKMSSDIPWKQ